MAPPPPELRSDELRACWAELRAAGEEAETLAAPLDGEQLWWRPEPDRWSIGECLDHLVRTGEAYLGALDEALEGGRRLPPGADASRRRTLLGRWTPRLLEPPPRLRLPAPEAVRPRAEGATTSPDRAAEDVLPRFLALRGRLGERLETADALDVGRIRVTSPFLSLVRFDVVSAFHVVAAHERRHLWQARRVQEREGFPES